jgi:hypothetical protein
LGVPEDSKSPTLGVLGFTPTLGPSGVATDSFIPPSISITSRCCSMGIAQFEKHSKCAKLVKFEVNEHMTIAWKRLIPMPIKLQSSLFHLFPYFRKFDWESSSLNDFKGNLASYRAYPKRWDEWVDVMFMAPFGLWTHKDQINQSLVYEINGLGFIGFYHVTYHLVGLFCNMLPWFDSSVNRYL